MGKQGDKISHMLLGAVVLLWGANVGIVKAAFQDTHPILFAAVRFTGSGILLLLLVLWKEKDLRIQRKDWTLITLVGGLGVGVYQILWSLGLERTSATNNALIFTISPLLGALYADWTKRESVQRRRYWGMLLALGGVILVILKPTARLHLSLFHSVMGRSVQSFLPGRKDLYSTGPGWRTHPAGRSLRPQRLIKQY